MALKNNGKEGGKEGRVLMLFAYNGPVQSMEVTADWAAASEVPQPEV